MSQIEDELRIIISKNLPRGGYKVFLFGSRATNSNKQFSDYDIGILGPKKLPISTLAKIENDLHNSDIPFKVDIVDLASTRIEFRKIALKKAKIWN